jgi:hypothetical protein
VNEADRRVLFGKYTPRPAPKVVRGTWDQIGEKVGAMSSNGGTSVRSAQRFWMRRGADRLHPRTLARIPGARRLLRRTMG